MTLEQQRVAIAEACGWTFHDLKYAHVGGGEVFEKFWLPPGIDIKTLSADDIARGPKHGRSAPDYPSDPAAALTFCDWLAGRGWFCRLGNGLDKTWECEFYRPAQTNTPPEHEGTIDGVTMEIHYAPANTSSLAICEAGLKAAGLWKDEEAG